MNPHVQFGSLNSKIVGFRGSRMSALQFRASRISELQGLKLSILLRFTNWRLGDFT